MQGGDPALWVGPAMDGGPIGVMVHIGPPRDVVVFRCMRPGGGFRRLMEGAETPYAGSTDVIWPSG